MLIYTVGHSHHPIDVFVRLLRAHDVDAVADVRSQPYSRWAPQFRKEPLSKSLRGAGIDYVFFGEELGGRPRDRSFYDDRGDVDYRRRSLAPDFQAGVERLIELASRKVTAVLCAEENPERCHRRLLVTPAIQRRGLRVLHLRGDGSAVPEAELRQPERRLPFDS